MELDLSSMADFSYNNNKITPEIMDFCKSVNIFEWLENSIFNEIMKNSYIVNFHSWTKIINEWDISNGKAYLILDWEVTVIVQNNVIAILEAWSLFWEYAIICEEDRSATVQARTDLKCLVIDKNNLLLLANEDFKINNILASRVEKNYEANVWGRFKD